MVLHEEQLEVWTLTIDGRRVRWNELMSYFKEEVREAIGRCVEEVFRAIREDLEEVLRSEGKPFDELAVKEAIEFIITKLSSDEEVLVDDRELFLVLKAMLRDLPE